jgi:hypothetical protein
MVVPGRSFGVLGTAHSFQLRLFAAHGRHVVRVYALNRGAGHDVLIRQATIRT